MYIAAGLAFIVMGVYNIFKILYTIIRYTPNALKDQVDVDVIMKNFMKNTSEDEISFIINLYDINPMIFATGIIFITIGLFI